MQKDRAWVWKNDKKRYEKFLTSLSWNQRSEIIQKSFLKDAAVFTTTIDVIKNEQNSWKDSYLHSKWFRDYYIYLKSGNLFENDSKVLRKTFDHRIDMKIDLLWICHRDAFLSCISERKIVSVLKKIHDNSEHWNKAIILIKLRNMTYWSNQSEDVERYIERCIQCARHESAIKSQSLHSIQMIQSFDLAVMNFIDSFKKTVKEKRYIFHFMNYFSRFSIPTATKIVDASDVIRCIRKIIQRYRKSVEIYCDHDQHFDNEELREFLKLEDIKITYSPSGASKSTDMIEVKNKLLQNVMRKIVMRNEWNLSLSSFTKSLNCHQIHHLELSSQDIFLSSETFVLAVEFKLLTASNVGSAENIMFTLNDSKSQKDAIRKYLLYRAETHDSIRVRFNARKKKEMIRYDREIIKTLHEIDFLAMIYQKNIAKLQLRWRKFFRITKYDESHHISFILAQLNDRKIRSNYHDDHLKIYRFRTEHLVNFSYSDEKLISYQTIRSSKKKKKILKIVSPNS